MITHPATNEPGRRGRTLAALLTAAVLLSVAAYGARGTGAIGQLSAARSGALLADLRSEEAGRLYRINDATVRAAIAAAPLDQRIINVAMARTARSAGARSAEAAAPWLRVLPRLGWRDTVALQNLLYDAAVAGDLSRIMDYSDALLRRRQMVDQMVPVMSLAEADPQLRAQLVRRLAAGPSWRGVYLTATGHLKTPEQLANRFVTIRLLQRRATRLDSAEVVPNILALDRAGLPRYAFALWQSVQPGVTRPLDDQNFALASRSFGTDEDRVPYQWQMLTGQGFSADASREGGRGILTIDWDGRGVPVFARQRTSAMPGRYALDVAVAGEDRVDLPAFAFRLACGGQVVPFRSHGAPTHFVTTASVPCPFPQLEIAGDLQPAASTHQVSFSRIVMRPLASFES